MRFRKHLLGGVAICAIAPALLVACGGDDDDDSGGSGGDSASSAGTGSDEAYVTDFCEATIKFGDELIAVLEDVGTEVDDEAAATKLLAKPLESLVAELRKAKPPKDVKKAHDEIVTKLNGAVKDLKDGKNAEQVFEALDEPKLDKDVSDRLNKAAEKVDACVEAGVSFSNDEG
ncbi:MAG: hypothetical protein ACKVVT_01880 [Dehalococcoidia bacterium]